MGDDIADQLIASNTARPRPGVEKPDPEGSAVNGLLRRRRSMQDGRESAFRQTEIDKDTGY